MIMLFEVRYDTKQNITKFKNIWSFFKLKNSWHITHEQDQAFLSFQAISSMHLSNMELLVKVIFELFEGISYFPACLTVGMQASSNSTAL